MKTVSVWKEVEIYKEAMQECCRIMAEALVRVHGIEKPCIMAGCIYEGLETCYLRGMSVSGASWCDKYEKGDE